MHAMQPIATDVTHSVVCVSVCVLFTRVSCAKTAEPIEMPFGRLTCFGQRNHVLDVIGIPMVRGNFAGVQPIENHWESLLQCIQQRDLQ